MRGVSPGLRLALALWLVAAPLAAQPTVNDLTLTVDTVVASGLDTPTAMAFLGLNDLLVLEKNTGRVRRVLNGVPQPTPALDVAVNTDSERGLLGIAITTETPPGVFLYYSEASGDPDGDGSPDGGTALGNRVYRYTWNAATQRLENRQLVLDLPIANGPNHDGGVLRLGPTPTPGPQPPVGDGSLLYVVIGDLNRGGQLQNNPSGAAPDDSGAILRVRQDGTAAPGNPFTPYCSVSTAQSCPAGSGCPGGQTCRTGVARLYAYGVRNSFGLALDPVSGALWDTENGPGSYDEINYVTPGFNSGWTPLMGPDSRDPEGVGNLFTMPGGGSAYSDPEFSWLTPVAVTGIVFPTGGALGPAYDQVALVGDFNTGQVYRFPLNQARTGFDLADVGGLEDLVADSTAERNLLRLGQNFGGISALERGPDGNIYVLSINGGALYRIRALNQPSPTPTATATPTPFAVGGSLQYYGGTGVPAATVVASNGGTTVSVGTASNGAYLAAPLPMGNWTLVPRKTGGGNLGVATLDATWILQHIAQLRPFSPAQTKACDVTGDGTCSTLDASYILQYVATVIARFPAATRCDSDWLFLPLPMPAPNQSSSPPVLTSNSCQMGYITFAPLVDSAGAQNFTAVLLGDVTGNWQP
ncbi:MAG: PQQ-dependent sugar dehydrogenase [Deltaproteobacteria bacterium]|nr:PQQ-dependent sugar dehydrogenase [Deltaproteobacteria bacterium]